MDKLQLHVVTPAIDVHLHTITLFKMQFHSHSKKQITEVIGHQSSTAKLQL